MRYKLQTPFYFVYKIRQNSHIYSYYQYTVYTYSSKHKYNEKNMLYYCKIVPTDCFASDGGGTQQLKKTILLTLKEIK